jgi:putative DNA primase/helicase
VTAVANACADNSTEPGHGKQAEAPEERFDTPEERDRRRRNIATIWNETVQDPGRIAEYLQHRGLSGQVPENLRLHRALGYFDRDAEGHLQHLGDFPTIVAPVQSADGEIVALHRTYLDPAGPGKAGVPAPKKLTPAIRPGATKGTTIRLAPAGQTLAISERIETGIAVMEATELPVWAAMSAGGVERVQIPLTVRRVVLWADNDTSMAGQQAVEKAAARLAAQGHEVLILLPPKPDSDWLDALNEQGPEALRAALTAATASPSPSGWPPPIPFTQFTPPPVSHRCTGAALGPGLCRGGG